MWPESNRLKETAVRSVLSIVQQAFHSQPSTSEPRAALGRKAAKSGRKWRTGLMGENTAKIDSISPDHAQKRGDRLKASGTKVHRV